MRLPPSDTSILVARIGLATGLLAATTAPGCLDRPLCASAGDGVELPEGFSDDCDPKTTNVFVQAVQQTAVDKIDLLFMIDNSVSMADKQEILADAVPDLVRALVNPVCVDRDTGTRTGPPDDIDANCPEPYVRDFIPVRDIHIGVISSSLGSYGADACVPEGRDATRDEMQDDHGRLIGARPRAFEAGVALANAVDGTPGFLSWDVTGGATQDVESFVGDFQELVRLTGEKGCGYEASLESWYRFLVDPEPPATVSVVDCPGGGQCALPQGVDEAVLAQRKAFLRSDSLLAVVMLSDENDCSIQGEGQLFYAATRAQLPAGSSVCATNPNDPCCYSCGRAEPPAGCAPDPACASVPFVPKEQDHGNLRCFEQKRRFGIDFLYPTARYVNALTNTQICPERPDLSLEGCAEPRPNPIFADVSGLGGTVRDASKVFLTGIIGVPWQDIAADRDPEGNVLPAPDADGDGTVENLRFMTARQLSGRAEDGVQRNVWLDILGAPEQSPPVAPRDDLMRESIEPRTGVASAVGVPLASPESGPFENPINGHEYYLPKADDLQYACIFKLPEAQEKHCPTEVTEGKGCDCETQADVDAAKNPLCQDPADGSYGVTQKYAKAYPGLRFLETLRDFGDNSIVASICPANTEARDLESYGYRPALGALVDRLKDALGGSCLPRELSVEESEVPGAPPSVPCSIVEAVPRPDEGCARSGRAAPAPDVFEPSFRRLREQGRCGGDGQPTCTRSDWTICEIEQSTSDSNGDGVFDCLQHDVTAQDVGWCYVDPNKGIGDAELVESCPATRQRMLRFVDRDADTPTDGATVLIACLGRDFTAAP